MSLPIISARQEKQLQRFYERSQKHYGATYEGHQLFLQHAAFPMLFSPDLLYQIWFNFRLYPLRGTLNSMEELPNMVVSDLVLSGICQEVGFELYQIDQKLRLYLLAQLQEDERFGHQRVKSLAQFLHQYSQQVQLKDADPRLKEIHQQLSIASLHPRHAAQEIGRSLQKAMLSNEAMEQMRLTKLLEMLAGQDEAFESLLSFSQQLKTQLTGQESLLEDSKSIANLVIAEADNSDTILKLKVPDRLRSKLKTFRDNEREGWTEAINRIETARSQGLKRLSLSKLDLRSLPEQLWSLTQLEELILHDNLLDQIPETIGRLHNLHTLNLGRNQLTSLPQSLSELKSLNKLIVHYNKLIDFPPSILLLSSLRHLDLGNNQIARIPDQLTYIAGIQKLYLNDNQLVELPDNLEIFTDLEVLQLHYNKLQALPEALLQLKSLQANGQKDIWDNGFRIDGNPIVVNLSEQWYDESPIDLLTQLFRPPPPTEEESLPESEALPQPEPAENYYSDFHQKDVEGGQRLYALLIGIDRYGDDIKSLEGCENDVRAMQDFLRRQLNFNGHSYQIMSLLNEKASKESVERAIQEFLGQAQEGEEVLFYFAGHGDIDESVLMQKMPYQDPLRKLVLYIEGRHFFSDFSSGEIGDMVRQMDRQKAQLTIIVDAGFASGTEAANAETRERHLRVVDLPRPSKSLPNPFEKSPIDTDSPFFEFYAANPRNTASEMILGEEVRGLFTYSLLESLRQKKGDHNIQNIQTEILTRMRQRAADSQPEFQVEHWQSESKPQFLGGMLTHQGASYEIRFVPEQTTWRLDAGYRDGLRATHPVTQEMSMLDVFEMGVPPEAMSKGEGLVGQVGAESVRARSSWVISQGNFELDPSQQYLARLNRLPIERLRFHVDENTFAIAKIASFRKDVMRYFQSDRERESELYLRPEKDAKKALYFLQAESQQLYLSHKRDRKKPILRLALGSDNKPHIPALVRQMIHLSKWDNILNLSNPNSQIDENQIALEIIGLETEEAFARAQGAYEFSAADPVRIRIKLHNRSSQALHLGLLYLSSDLAVSPIPISEGNLLEPGQSIMAIDGETATLAFSRRQQEMGQNEATDYFKLIASPEPFNPQVLEMLDIDRQSNKGPERSIVNWTNTHSLLFDETGGRYQDWNTRLYQVKLIFPNPS